jgi:hypothetical protein
MQRFAAEGCAPARRMGRFRAALHGSQPELDASARARTPSRHYDRGVRGLVLVCGLAAAALVSGCGGSDGLPDACHNGSEAIVHALRDAPGRVALEGNVPLSRCVKRAIDPDDVQHVGGTMVSVATELSARARGHPESPAALQLGYLLGAAHRGGDSTLVSAELLRRLDQEAAGLEARSHAFERGQRAGRAAG